MSAAPLRRLAIVTGAGRARGIGAAVARRLADRGLCEAAFPLLSLLKIIRHISRRQLQRAPKY